MSNYIGILRIAWDGRGSAGEAMPTDFSHVEIHASTTSGFTPNPVPLPSGGTLIGQLRGAQAYPYAPPGSVGDVDYDITWFDVNVI